MKNKTKKIAILWTLVCLALSMGSACQIRSLDGEKEKDLDYTVVKEEEIPEKVKRVIAKKQESDFQITFVDDGSLYILRGYGRQPTGGYSIQVNSLYLAGESIHVETNLIGPVAGEKQSREPSCPVIVIRLERREEPVVFA